MSLHPDPVPRSDAAAAEAHAACAGAQSPGSSTARRLAVLVPALAALLVFWPVLQAAFVYDDLPLLRHNAFVHSWSALWKAWTTPLWETVSETRYASGYHRPVGVVVFTLLHRIGGGAPWTFHLASILLHAACSALLARLALALGWRPLAAGAAGLLFAAHGAHLEPVAWASSLTYLLAAAFALLGLRALLCGRSTAAAIALALAALAHESAFGVWLLAFALVALRRAPMRAPDRDGPAAARRPVFLRLGLGLLAVYLLRALAFGGPGAGFGRESIFDLLGAEPIAYGMLDRLVLALSLVWRYLAFLAWPWPHQPFRVLELDVQAGDWQLLGPALLGAVVLLAGAILWLRARAPRGLLAVPLGLLIATLLPLLDLGSLAEFPFEERYVYLASCGFALLLAGVAIGRKSAAEPRWRAPLGAAALAVVAAVQGASVRASLAPWRSHEAFFEHARSVSPNSLTAHLQYGNVLLDQAQRAPDGPPRDAILDHAFAVFEQAQGIDRRRYLVNPVDWAKLHASLGNALLLGGDHRSAHAFFERFLERSPGSPEGHLGLANAEAMQAEELLRMGQADAARTQLESALGNFERALRLDPDEVAARFGRGRTLVLLGRTPEAIDPLTAAFESESGNERYARTLAEAWREVGRFARARAVLEQHLQAAPDSRTGALQMGILLAQLGEELVAQGKAEEAVARTREALPWFEKALDAPTADDSAEAAFGLGRARALLGRPQDGVQALQAAFDLRPQVDRYARLLAAVQEASGAPVFALRTLRKHLEFAPESAAREEFLTWIARLDS